MGRGTERSAASILRERLPVHPKSAEIVLRLLHRRDGDLTDLDRAIQMDPALTAAVLRAANSAHLGYSRRIAGVRHAMVLIGESLVASLAASRVADLVFDEKPPVYVDWLWPHSVATACGAAVIAKRLGESSDEAYTIGLLHDIGWLLAAANDESPDGNDAAYAMRGATLLSRWNAPDSVVAGVSRHHIRANPVTTVAEQIIIAAHAFAAKLGAESPEPSVSTVEALKLVGIDVRPSVIVNEIERELVMLTAGFTEPARYAS